MLQLVAMDGVATGILGGAFTVGDGYDFTFFMMEMRKPSHLSSLSWSFYRSSWSIMQSFSELIFLTTRQSSTKWRAGDLIQDGISFMYTRKSKRPRNVP